MLPIGTVIVLNNSKTEYMIFGQKICDTKGRVRDYLICPFPEGSKGTNDTFVVDETDIDRVLFMGFHGVTDEPAPVNDIFSEALISSPEPAPDMFSEALQTEFIPDREPDPVQTEPVFVPKRPAPSAPDPGNVDVNSTVCASVFSPGFTIKVTLRYKEGSEQKELKMTEDRLTVGREIGNNLMLLNSGYLSRWHAVFSIRDDRLFLEDLASKNGTFINGDKLLGEKELTQSCEVRFGNTPVDVIIER